MQGAMSFEDSKRLDSLHLQEKALERKLKMAHGTGDQAQIAKYDYHLRVTQKARFRALSRMF